MDEHLQGILPNHVELLKIAFDQFDRDQSGTLEVNEIQAMFDSFGQPLTEKEADLLLQALGIERGSSLTLNALQEKIEMARSKIDRREFRKTILTAGMRLRKRVTPPRLFAFHLMLRRGMIQILREFKRIFADALLLIAFGVFSALVFGANWSVSNFPMICLLACLAMGLLGTNASLRLFGKERLIFWREASSGIPISSYFASKLLLELLQTVTYPFIFLLAFYNIIIPELPFALMYTVFVSIYFYSSGLGIFISILVSPGTATLVGVLAPIILGGFFSGLAPQLSSMGPILQALAQTSFSRWGIEALCAAESSYMNAVTVDAMYYQGYERGFDQVFYRNVRNVVIIGVAFRFAAALAICIVNRDKRQ
eukprot:TRINITY_DN8966_c0_g1_i1.p1 TRINITY_DN8966_c0_g1~~TRINITY_DN8966_c0_g1_i1.p1  ORF type:complete len:418 (-),score=91.74 TRINITY_DN8966_c0_g1_i1:27-1130(-)